MPSLEDHPTVRKVRERLTPPSEEPLDASWLRALCLECGADDAGFVEVDRPGLEEASRDARELLPGARTLVSFVVRMNREAIRAPARSVSNVEFHHAGDQVNEVGRRLVRALEDRGLRAVSATMGFPMEADRWPERMWVLSHKPVAEAAGLGRMGLHRNVIHPRFGSFVLLGTVILDLPVATPSAPLDYNPCVSCKLCVAACPTGAIHPDGRFDFAACYTHNYREFMGGFSDWVETVADSRSAADYRSRVEDRETVSMWQSLSFGANYKAAYCLSVCPAGEDVLGPFLQDRAGFLGKVVRPLQDKAETVYVVAGSAAEAHVARRFPRKRARRVRNGLRPSSAAAFLRSLHLAFLPDRAKGLDGVFHFLFTGGERLEATVTIRDQKLQVQPGLQGRPDLRVEADASTWVRFLRREGSLAWALLRRRVRLRGRVRLLPAFGRCFA